MTAYLAALSQASMLAFCSNTPKNVCSILKLKLLLLILILLLLLSLLHHYRIDPAYYTCTSTLTCRAGPPASSNFLLRHHCLSIGTQMPI